MSKRKPSRAQSMALPPGAEFFSSTSTLKPLCASSAALASPENPAPTMTTLFPDTDTPTPALYLGIAALSGAKPAQHCTSLSGRSIPSPRFSRTDRGFGRLVTRRVRAPCAALGRAEQNSGFAVSARFGVAVPAGAAQSRRRNRRTRIPAARVTFGRAAGGPLSPWTALPYLHCRLPERRHRHRQHIPVHLRRALRHRPLEDVGLHCR